MDTYVCLILNSQRQILTVEALSAKTEPEALERAKEYAATMPAAQGFELWRKGKKITYSVASADGGSRGM